MIKNYLILDNQNFWGILHDQSDEVLEREFKNASSIFAEQIKELSKLDRSLTRNEKDKLIFTLSKLLELHSIIKY